MTASLSCGTQVVYQFGVARWDGDPPGVGGVSHLIRRTPRGSLGEASNLSPRTIRAYTDDGALLAVFLAVKSTPTAVLSIRREQVEAFIVAELQRTSVACRDALPLATAALQPLNDKGEIDVSAAWPVSVISDWPRYGVLAALPLQSTTGDHRRNYSIPANGRLLRHVEIAAGSVRKRVRTICANFVGGPDLGVHFVSSRRKVSGYLQRTLSDITTCRQRNAIDVPEPCGVIISCLVIYSSTQTNAYLSRRVDGVGKLATDTRP